MPIIDYAGGDITVTGTAIVTMGTNPMVDVQGAVIDNNAFSAGGFVGEANIVYSLGIDQVTSPPHAVSFIPVVITANGSVSGNESYIHGSVSGPDIPYYELLPPNVLRIDLSPNTAYFVGLDARCTAESPGRGVSSSCQAVADPAFQFDQAAFDTLMGTNTFQLADYYSFAYSPELTPPPPPPPTSTPEPSGLVLLGAGLFAVLIGVPGRIRK